MVKPSVLSNLISRLESGDHVTLSAEWEVAVFDAFSRCIAIEVEPALGGKSLIDLLVLDRGIHSAGLAIEVATISNQNIEALNPIDEFWSRLNAAFERFGIPPGGIHLSVASRFHLQRKNAVVLSLPSLHLMDQMIKKHIYPMLREISASGNPAFKRIKDGETELLVSWKPGTTMNSGSYLGFDRGTYAYQNALINRLNEKRKQLKKSGHKGISGVFVCDGGASFFELLAKPGASFYDIRRDVTDFLRQTSTVHFVSFLFVTATKRTIAIETIFSEDASVPMRAEIEALFRRAADRLPQPLTDPNHALRIMKVFGGNRAWRFDHSLPGGGRDSRGRETLSIKVPAAAVVEMLGGRMTFDEFAHAAGLFWHKPGQVQGNVLMGGGGEMSLSDVRLRRTESDDDWIVFDFVDDDPASRRFQ